MKKMKSINLIAAVLCAMAFAMPARAETAEDAALPTLWGYDECVAYAKSHNISLQQSQLTRESGLVDLEAAKAQWFPSLNFSTSQGFTNYPLPADGMKGNSYSGSYGFSAGWTVYNGGKRENTIKRIVFGKQYIPISDSYKTEFNDYIARSTLSVAKDE